MIHEFVINNQNFNLPKIIIEILHIYQHNIGLSFQNYVINLSFLKFIIFVDLLLLLLLIMLLLNHLFLIFGFFIVFYNDYLNKLLLT